MIMKKICLLLFTFLLPAIQAFTQNQGTKFTERLSWSEVKQKAKKEKKYVFIDVYATWCGPCKAMDVHIYPDDKIGSLLNGNFICIKVQQDRTNRDSDNVRAWYNDANSIIQKYHIETLPTFLFLTADGDLMHQGLGYQDTIAFRQMVSIALTNPIAKLRKQLTEYRKGRRDSSFLRDLVLLASDEQDRSNASMIAAEHIKHMKAPFAIGNLEFIQRFTQKSTDPGFEIFYKNMDKINQILGKNQAERIVRKVIGKEEIEPYIKTNITHPNWDSLTTVIKGKYGSIGEEKVIGARMLYHLERKEWKSFGEAYERYYQTAISRSEYHINNISWSVFEHVSDADVLAVAIKATKFNVENYSKDDALAMDTYANLLYKAGRKEEAIEAQRKAVQLSNESKKLLETLRKMQNGMKTWPTDN